MFWIFILSFWLLILQIVSPTLVANLFGLFCFLGFKFWILDFAECQSTFDCTSFLGCCFGLCAMSDEKLSVCIFLPSWTFHRGNTKIYDKNGKLLDKRWNLCECTKSGRRMKGGRPGEISLLITVVIKMNIIILVMI